MTIITLLLYNSVIIIIILLNCFNYILCNYYIGNLSDKIKIHIIRNIVPVCNHGFCNR